MKYAVFGMHNVSRGGERGLKKMKKDRTEGSG